MTPYLSGPADYRRNDRKLSPECELMTRIYAKAATGTLMNSENPALIWPCPLALAARSDRELPCGRPR